MTSVGFVFTIVEWKIKQLRFRHLNLNTAVWLNSIWAINAIVLNIPRAHYSALIQLFWETLAKHSPIDRARTEEARAWNNNNGAPPLLLFADWKSISATICRRNQVHVWRILNNFLPRCRSPSHQLNTFVALGTALCKSIQATTFNIVSVQTQMVAQMKWKNNSRRESEKTG